jgi:prepilin-type N-terminal cleavage/methylation domain-containing protein
MKRRLGFTLIELLAVIAIIAILSAIIFPVFARARDNAKRSGDLTAMNELRNAILLYKTDTGAFPPALLGYATIYTSGPQINQVIPADTVQGFLHPKRVASFNTFKPARNEFAKNLATPARWPVPDARAVGSTPVWDCNGDGVITNADDVAGTRQAYTNTDTVQRILNNPSSGDASFYQISGYDVFKNPGNIGARANQWEIRYTLFWSAFAIGTGAGQGSGSAVDDPRQLGYSDPPDETVVTWNSFFRDWEASGTDRVPARNKNEIVLFLGGGARPYDARRAYEQTWRMLP